jgi:hypothetical protein
MAQPTLKVKFGCGHTALAPVKIKSRDQLTQYRKVSCPACAAQGK